MNGLACLGDSCLQLRFGDPTLLEAFANGRQKFVETGVCRVNQRLDVHLRRRPQLAGFFCRSFEVRLIKSNGFGHSSHAVSFYPRNASLNAQNIFAYFASAVFWPFISSIWI